MLAAVILATVAGPGSDVVADEPDPRLRAMRSEIERLRRDLELLASQEEGVLGEIERLGAESRLRRAEAEEAGARLQRLQDEIGTREHAIGSLEARQGDRRSYLSFRLREMYKQGPGRDVRLAMGGDDVEGYLGGLRYAAYLSGRDHRILHEFRNDRDRLIQERSTLVEERSRVLVVRRQAESAGLALERARSRRSRVLASLRDDREVRNAALGELEGASRTLGALVDGRSAGDERAVLDIRRFRGVLDLPVDASIDEPFGKIVHPRFKTVVPHPGLDLGATEGVPFRAVFDGRVIYASWLRGYGLTAIVDHGGDILSVYAHASVLTVEEGEAVLRGQAIGRVGETGSLKGPYLYFELRDGGKPVDPEPWFRRR